MFFDFFKKKKKQPEPVQVWQESNESFVPQDFKYKLTIENALQVNGHKEFIEPTDEQLIEAINNNKLADDNFFTLESATPVNGCTLLQAMGFCADRINLEAEVIRDEIERGERISKAYHKEVSQDEMLGLMQDFLQGYTPDIDGDSGWYFFMEV